MNRIRWSLIALGLLALAATPALAHEPYHHHTAPHSVPVVVSVQAYNPPCPSQLVIYPSEYRVGYNGYYEPVVVTPPAPVVYAQPVVVVPVHHHHHYR